MHLSEKAVDPPGEARPDLDIFLDFARRLDLRDKDGEPLVKWRDAGGARSRRWKECSRGRPCDYTGLSYDKLRGGSGIQWPCTDEHPDGTERLYADGQFWADPDYCESYGRDLVTGAPVEPTEYKALNPDGKAVLKAAEYLPPHELPERGVPVPADHRPHALPLPHPHEDRPGAAAAGRRPRGLGGDVRRATRPTCGLGEGDLLEITHPARPRRGAGCGSAASAPGVVFLPFHYGYWDTPAGRDRGDRAGGQRADDHRLGPGLQAAALQDRGRRGAAARGVHAARRRPPPRRRRRRRWRGVAATDGRAAAPRRPTRRLAGGRA